jgi:hypothetical protein
MNDPMRASDEDRERVVVMLHEQVGAGRLTLDEFSQRSASAYQSRTVGELHALTRDLPKPVPEPVSSPTVAARPNLMPVLLVLALVLLLGGIFFAITSLSAADSMTQMMNNMMGR